MNHTKKCAVLLSCLLLLLTAGSLIFILLPKPVSTNYIADIYQNGDIIASIPLNQVDTTYTFLLTGENGCTNEIEVQPGRIGIRSADCPDKLCVQQGFISDTKLPITCLPNRVVISLRPRNDSAGQLSITPDIITY